MVTAGDLKAAYAAELGEVVESCIRVGAQATQNGRLGRVAPTGTASASCKTRSRVAWLGSGKLPILPGKASPGPCGDGVDLDAVRVDETILAGETVHAR
jgi:hypothetical protein